MRKLAYAAVAVVTVTLFVIVVAPAQTVWSFIADDVQSSVPQLKIANISGSVWEGKGDMQFQSYPVVRIDWRLAALPLLIGNASADINASAEGFSAALQGVFSQDSSTISFDISFAEATIGSDYINQVTLQYGLDLSGDFQLRLTNAVFADGWLTSVSGAISWPGGIVHIEMPGQIHTSKLPPLNGILSLEDDSILLKVTNRELEMMNVRLKRSGWAEVAVSHAFIRMANLPLPPGSESTDSLEPAFLLEEKIL